MTRLPLLYERMEIMHYVTLVAVNIPEIEDEPEVDEGINGIIDELKKEICDKGDIEAIMPKVRLKFFNSIRTPFARQVNRAVEEEMEPYSENTEDPRYLEFVDMTEETEEEYEEETTEMVRLPDGTFVSPHSKPFADKFVVRNGKVYQRKAGPCSHEMRTAKAKKMRVVRCPYNKVYPTLRKYAEERCGYTYDEVSQGYGYYTNPRSFWDWYQIGGRWPFELLVRADCEEYSLGEREEDDVIPSSPEGYIWVSAARKKDIAWDVMRECTEQKAKTLFKEFEKAFEEGKLPDGYFGQIKEDGISGWGGMNYIKGECVEEFLKRRHPEIFEKYCIHPYGFLDEDGWNTHETFVYEGANSHFEQKDEWRNQLNDFIENADDNTVFVIVDNHN